VVTQTKYCCSPKIKNFPSTKVFALPKKFWAGYATVFKTKKIVRLWKARLKARKVLLNKYLYACIHQFCPGFGCIEDKYFQLEI